MSTAKDTAPSVARIQPVSVPRPAEVFADILRDKIFTGEFQAGEALPPERVLVEQSQLSRATVRDALAILKQQGLIITKPGRNGGSIVSRPTQQDLIASLDVYLLSKGWGPENPTLAETREVIEPWCAALAAARRTEADIERMRECVDAMIDVEDNVAAYIQASQKWHFAVADASHNSLLAALMRVRSDAARSHANQNRYSSLTARRASIDFHGRVTDQIADRQPQKAYDVMVDHIRGSSDLLMDRLVVEAGH